MVSLFPRKSPPVYPNGVTPTVTGQDDQLGDGAQSYLITGEVNSDTDTNYDILPNFTVGVSNTSDE
ncbi:MAG: hypothetical protein AAF355_12335 [Myxococcota bacterium]